MDLSWPEVVLFSVLALGVLAYFSFIVWCTTNGRNIEPRKRAKIPMPMWTSTTTYNIPGDKPGKTKDENTENSP